MALNILYRLNLLVFVGLFLSGNEFAVKFFNTSIFADTYSDQLSKFYSTHKRPMNDEEHAEFRTFLRQGKLTLYGRALYTNEPAVIERPLAYVSTEAHAQKLRSFVHLILNGAAPEPSYHQAFSGIRDNPISMKQASDIIEAAEDFLESTVTHRFYLKKLKFIVALKKYGLELSPEEDEALDRMAIQAVGRRLKKAPWLFPTEVDLHSTEGMRSRFVPAAESMSRDVAPIGKLKFD